MRRPLALTAALLTALAAAPAHAHAGPRWVHSCTAPARADTASCDALRVIGTAAAAGDGGYGPAELRAAYGLPADGGGDAVIAVVDAYDHPRAEADLGVYREHYG
ncbi:MAG: peptidase S8, partial [Kitasatospora sp.]|nr:peptidase S8 [Kitasatospora sp.]